MRDRYLFRAITDSSHGTTSQSSTSPALVTPDVQGVHGAHIAHETTDGNMLASLIELSLPNDHQADNPFAFSTTSHLLALQHALDQVDDPFFTTSHLLALQHALDKAGEGGK